MYVCLLTIRFCAKYCVISQIMSQILIDKNILLTIRTVVTIMHNYVTF